VTVFSGGARGVDKLAADGALEEGGHAVAVLADSLQDSLRRKELRDAVLSGRLTLVSASSPSARFTVAAAMGRNKLIYVLSSAAVVVSAAFEKVGTWTGAIENLRAGWVPLFVRDGRDVPDGNRELINRGGRAVQLEELGSNIDALLAAPTLHQEASLVREAGAAYAAAQPVAGSPKDDGSEHIDAADPFPSVWPRLAAFLAQPRTEAEVSQALHLDQGQTQMWLQRAVALGLVRKLSNPIRFHRIDNDESQASLFET